MSAGTVNARTVSVFGATGSIGDSTLDVIRQHPEKFKIKGLVARNNSKKLAALARKFNPETVIITNEAKLADLRDRLAGWRGTIQGGEQAVLDLAGEPTDLIVSAITGISGLGSTYRAFGAGNTVALANKESLVCAGRLMLDWARNNGARILPLDSEHSAVFQCLRGEKRAGVSSVTLTASGGPFRGKTTADLARVTKEQALAHPNWDMGPKVTIDSATLANKGLEYIEAAYLFGLSPQMLDVVVHPQSLIHSYVTYIDGSTLAQLGQPDMRTPIATALAFPDRIALDQKPLDLAQIGQLTFEPVDHETFPALKLAKQAFGTSPVAPIVYNAANEVAVAAFLAGEIGFLGIARHIERCLSMEFGSRVESIEAVWAIDAAVRQKANILKV